MSDQDETRVERGPSTQRPEALGMAILLEREGKTVAASLLREQHAENERMRADAERYRYLLGHARRIDVAGWSISHMEQLSARIDAAREES